MIFADDIAFWTNKKEKLEQALAVLNVCIKEAGLKRNTRKTEILTISKTLGEPVDNEIQGDMIINNAANLKYLGCKFIINEL